MEIPTPQLIVSGVPYTVTEVDGHPPATLTDLIGPARLVAEGRTGRHEVLGEGALVDGKVRFHEKFGEGGKDLRVWEMVQTSDGISGTVC